MKTSEINNIFLSDTSVDVFSFIYCTCGFSLSWACSFSRECENATQKNKQTEAYLMKKPTISDAAICTKGCPSGSSGSETSGVSSV